jgi:hypothetical protein
LRIDEGVPKAVEDDSGDVALGVEAGGGEPVGELFANTVSVVVEGSGEDFRAA